MQSWDEMKRYVGKRCTVIVSYIEGEEDATETGKLLKLNEDGDAELLSDRTKQIQYMWPVLEIKDAE